MQFSPRPALNPTDLDLRPVGTHTPTQIKSREADMRWVLVLSTVTLLATVAVACGGDDDSSEPGVPTAAPGELRAQGQAITMIVSPAEDSTLTGTVQVTVPDVPEGTASVWFSLVPEGGDVREGAPNLGKGTKGVDAWGLMLDTTDRADGSYTLVALPFDADPPGQGTPPLDIAQVEVTIANGP
jgi:hypothetical protein